MPDEYLLRLEASGEVTPAPDERNAAQSYARAFNTPPSAEAGAYIRDRLAGSRAQPDSDQEPEEAEQ